MPLSHCQNRQTTGRWQKCRLYAERVKACQTAQITGGTDGLALVAAAQGDKQIIGGKTALTIDVPIALYRHSVNTHEICVGLACGQLCRHAVDAGIDICRTQPIF